VKKWAKWFESSVLDQQWHILKISRDFGSLTLNLHETKLTDFFILKEVKALKYLQECQVASLQYPWARGFGLPGEVQMEANLRIR